METEREILNVLRRQEAAIARGDVEATLEPMAKDAVIYDLPPPLEHRGSPDLAAEGLAAWFDTWERGVTAELAEPTVIVEGDLAVVHGLSRMRGVKKGEGELDAWNRRTIVLRRRGGVWRIVHEHSSYPLRMDGSGKAATDLKPDR